MSSQPVGGEILPMRVLRTQRSRQTKRARAGTDYTVAVTDMVVAKLILILFKDDLDSRLTQLQFYVNQGFAFRDVFLSSVERAAWRPGE